MKMSDKEMKKEWEKVLKWKIYYNNEKKWDIDVNSWDID